MWIALSLIVFGCVSGDVYTEDLTISRLPSGNLMTAFRFTLTSESLHLGPNYTLFPRIVSELISGHSISELTFFLTQGRWQHTRWGMPPQPHGPTGASVLAWLNGNETEASQRWGTLINSLNGLLCTAMTSAVAGLTSSPTLAFRPRGPRYGKEMHLRYVAVGKESVCTENLTPWKKLLPCKQHGLVTLLNPLKLYSSVYHAMGIDLHPQREGSVDFYRLQLYVYTVFDVPEINSKLDWSITELFSRKAVGVCSAATSSKVLVQLDKGIRLDPPPPKIERSFAVYDFLEGSSDSSFTVAAFYEDVFDGGSSNQDKDVVSVSSFLGGADQHHGTLSSVIKNEGNLLRATYTHQLPWFMMLYYHTLSVKCFTMVDRHEIVPAVHKRHFVPAIARKSPALIELEMELPQKSECRIQIWFEKAFLRIREYPPDANHGMYIPGAIVTLTGYNTSVKSDSQRTATTDNRLVLYGNLLLVALPVPDFSMPFNVICFVMTTVSLCFGPIHGFSTKMLIPVNSALPSSSFSKKLFRAFLLVLLALAFYAQYREMSLHEIRRNIEQFFEKMNSV